MHRRSFLAAAAALGSMPILSPEVRGATKSAGLKITGVEIWRLTGNPEQMKAYQASFGHGTTRNLRILPASQLYLKILTNEGVEGFYGTFDQTAAEAVKGIAQSIIGQDPLAIDTIWERMHGGAHRYSGTYVFGLSTIDNCLWDLKGKFFGVPVYRLLGGSRKTIDVYGSCIGQSLEPDRVRESAAQLKQEGYKSQKWFPTRGPSVHGLIVCPHNQRSTALAHIVASQPPAVCPFMEYQIDIQPNLYYFDKNQLIPKNSQITLPDLPGLGIELDESRIVSMKKIYPEA